MEGDDALCRGRVIKDVHVGRYGRAELHRQHADCDQRAGEEREFEACRWRMDAQAWRPADQQDDRGECDYPDRPVAEQPDRAEQVAGDIGEHPGAGRAGEDRIEEPDLGIEA
jgi:hypothetical protein